MIAQQFFFPKPKPPQGNEVAKQDSENPKDKSDEKSQSKSDEKKKASDGAGKSKQDPKQDGKQDPKQDEKTKESGRETKKFKKLRRDFPSQKLKKNLQRKKKNSHRKMALPKINCSPWDRWLKPRALVCWSPSIEKAEPFGESKLNSRWPDGKLRYRDVENKTGYFGQLELTPNFGRSRSQSGWQRYASCFRRW